MTAAPNAAGGPFVVARPGIARTMGILNVIFAILLGVYALYSAFMTLAMGLAEPPSAEAGAKATPGDNIVAMMTGPEMVRFGVLDVATALPLNILMFATGIGLLNLRPWGAKWWAWGCWAKLVRVVAVWGYFLIAVVPTLSTGMARSVVAMLRSQKGAKVGPSTLEQVTLVYTVMFSAVGATVIVVGVLYPAVSLWLLGRPGVKVALAPTPSPPHPPEMEPGLP